MNMIEKVAEALRFTDQDFRGADWYELAKAAIAAMREPTEEMLKAVDDEEERLGYIDSAYETIGVNEAWPVMIDAALAADPTHPST